MKHLALAFLLASPLVSAAAETVNWPQYRGANADGLAEGETLPDTWSTTENVVWKADIPGWGWSSPVIWGDRIFVTSAVGEAELKKPIIGGYPGGNVRPTDVHRWMVYCLDFDTGKVVWEREAHKGVPPQPRHPRNSYANATPVTDGQRVYAHFGNIGMFCYDMDGKVLWELTGTSGLVSLTPVAKHGLLYAGAGYHYGPLYAIRPGASGDISLQPGETSNKWIAWSQSRGSSIHPCYLISDDRLYVCFDAGLLACSNAKTGETIYQRQRLNTGGGRFYASPWAYNGKIFLLNEDGTTWVVEDGPEFKVLRKNRLDDNAWATPAIARGSLFIRTYTGLYRLQKPRDARPGK